MRRVLFVSGTRADYGKLKPLIEATSELANFEAHVAVTGMHMLPEYGLTRIEVERNSNCKMHSFENIKIGDNLTDSFCKTVIGINKVLSEINPSLVIVHGDRMEALAGATAAMFNHILIAHIEGGEISGTLDETMRHAITKLSNFHFVANEEAFQRILQLGEVKENIFLIGSPEADVMTSDKLPSISEVRNYYGIPFDDFGIMIFHPDSHDMLEVDQHASLLVDTVMKTSENFVVIHPNNDPHSETIMSQYARLRDLPNFIFFPSMRFEYYLAALKSAKFIIGNSSSGVREAPIYGVPSLDLGERQQNRSAAESIVQSNFDFEEMHRFFANLNTMKFEPQLIFGEGNASSSFARIISVDGFMNQKTDKSFISLENLPNVHHDQK